MAISQMDAHQQVFGYIQTQEETNPAVLVTDAFYDDLREGKSAEDLVVLNFFIEQIKISATAQSE